MEQNFFSNYREQKEMFPQWGERQNSFFEMGK